VHTERMKTHSMLWAMLVVAGLGCGPQRNTLGLTWRLEGRTCDLHPEITSVQVTLVKDSIPTVLSFPCSGTFADRTPGTVLTDLPDGVETVIVEASSVRGVRYAETFKVDLFVGRSNLDLNLPRHGAPDHVVSIGWAVPADSSGHVMTCAEAGIDRVEVRVDSNPRNPWEGAQTFPCEAGTGGRTVRVGVMDGLNHDISLTAISEKGSPPYWFYGELPLEPGVQQFTWNKNEAPAP